MFKQLFRTKSLDAIIRDTDEPQHQLKRSLGVVDLILLGIGAIIGTGIFATIGAAAAGNPTAQKLALMDTPVINVMLQYLGQGGEITGRLGAGPGVALSFVITAVACVFCALCYAEFASLVPIAGSAYTYSYASLGELVAWIIGWDLIIEYAIGNVAVAISWAAYFHQLWDGLGVHIPAWLSVDYRSAFQASEAVAAAGGNIDSSISLNYEAWISHPTIMGIPIIFNFLAFIIVAAVTWLLVIGVKESARANNVMVILKVLILLFFIGVGAMYVKPENWSPFMPNGFSGVWSGASLIFFAFIGFDAISTTAEECKNPGKDMPMGIIGSLVICTVIYIATAFVLTGVERWQNLGVADPLASVFASLGLNWAAGIIALGAVFSMTAVLLVFQLGQPRIFFAMSRDGLLPKYFAKVHPKYKTPHVTTIWTGIVVAVFSGFANINEVVELTNIGTLFAFILVCVDIIILRRIAPERKRMFKTPLVPLIPLLGIGMCLYLMLGLPVLTWARFGVWLLIGAVIYLLYGIRRSKQRTT
ncbi:MAG: amino acid permease [Bacteroidetes bacterium]|nr:MAG: amino acid permease [Bacteroidota bacterium]